MMTTPNVSQKKSVILKPGVPLSNIGNHESSPTWECLERSGGTTTHTDWIRSGDHSGQMIDWIESQMPNPHECTADDTVNALCRASDGEGWGIPDIKFGQLMLCAPPWPKGRYAYRSLRIRFLKGGVGVGMTFQRHLDRIKTVFGRDKVNLWEGFDLDNELSKKVSFRLLNGDESHVPVIEWICFDLGKHRRAKRTHSVRSALSLADELLAFTWLFPDAIRNMHHEQEGPHEAIAAGYEVDLPNIIYDTRSSFGILPKACVIENPKFGELPKTPWADSIMIGYGIDERVSIRPWGVTKDSSPKPFHWSVPELIAT